MGDTISRCEYVRVGMFILVVFVGACAEELQPMSPIPSTDAEGDVLLLDASNAVVLPSVDATTNTRDVFVQGDDMAIAPFDAGVLDLEVLGCSGDFPCADEFPARFDGNTLDGERAFDRYPCKESADESGPELVYEIIVPEAGFLSIAVYDEDGVDVDAHILAQLDPESCLSRGHHGAKFDAEPGRYFVVVDSFVSQGQEQAGEFTLDVGLYIPSRGPCDTEVGEMPRVRDGGDHLSLPATGSVVLEAHLVTAEEPAPFPSASREQLLDHYELSEEATGFVMHRRQNWAPLEGGSFYGAGIGPSRLLPVLDEAWYVCMYWTRSARPSRGDRMIFRRPGTNRAVVVAAGHETGPGNLDHIAGTTEETHHYLGTGHLDDLTLGIAENQDLPLGPRVCTD